MSKIYVPTYEDLKVNNGTELQLKAPGSGKTLAECELGEVVHIPETISDVKDFHDYIVIEKTQDNVTLLRKYVASGDSGIIREQYNSSGNYGGPYISYDTAKNTADIWCTTTFYNRFSDYTKEFITNKSIKAWCQSSNGQASVQEITRKVFLPSVDELGGTPSQSSTELIGNPWFTTNAERICYDEETKLVAKKYWTRTYQGGSGSSHYAYRNNYIGTDGSIQYETNYNNNEFYRPAIVFLPTTPLNGNNQFIDEPVYTDTIHDIRFGDNIYKIKDSDARDLLATLQAALGDKQDTLTQGDNITISNNVISATVPVTDVQDEGGASLVSGGIAVIPSGGGFYVGSTPPEDTSLLWIDTSDDSVDTLIDADSQSY